MTDTKQFFGGVCATLLLSFLAGCATRDPVYEGRRLSSWLQNYDVHSKTRPGEQADAAVRGTGEIAVPMLLCLLRERVKSQEYEFHVKHRRAIFAIDALGPKAEVALPDLQRIAYQDEACRPYAEFAIGAISSAEFRSSMSRRQETNIPRSGSDTSGQ